MRCTRLESFRKMALFSSPHTPCSFFSLVQKACVGSFVLLIASGKVGLTRDPVNGLCSNGRFLFALELTMQLLTRAHFWPPWVFLRWLTTPDICNHVGATVWFPLAIVLTTSVCFDYTVAFQHIKLRLVKHDPVLCHSGMSRGIDGHTGMFPPPGGDVIFGGSLKIFILATSMICALCVYSCNDSKEGRCVGRIAS